MAEDALASGARIGSYEVIERLGAGGMGEVYRARDLRLGRSVALKLLPAGAGHELLHRLQREARAASALNHPNIVQIYDVGETPEPSGAHYVVMEYVEGETLRRRLAPGPLPIAELLELGAQLADGLAKAHRAGIVHRDLKPENLMVTPEGLLKILDFGLAKRVEPLQGLEARETLSRYGTQAGVLLGTIEYMSPEQASGRVLDHRTDQFSLGLILYEMTAGRSPFRRDTPAQVLAAVIERDPEPLGRLRGDVPAALEALVERCLQKDPRRRFETTDELSGQLAALATGWRSGQLARSTSTPPPQSPAISVQVMPSASRPEGPPLYHVQTRRRVRYYAEGELAALIRRGKLTGMELARRDDEGEWRPLFQSRVFRREVPNVGDPRDAARRRALRALGGHYMGFVITAVVMYATQGHFPFWLAIWGAVLALQTLRRAPALWALLHGSREAVAPGAIADSPAGEARRLPAPAAEPAAPSSVAREAARVRALIEQRGGGDAARLVAEVDGILALTAELTARQADLEEQTSESERAGLAAAVAEARSRLERAELAQDRRLFERQLEVLQGREEAIAKAMRVLERLRVRREVAEHQLKQLRLDLSRGAAHGLDVPELSSRLEFIRYEVDAREEVEEIAAGPR
jgi:serine/threonine protein kinase